MIRTYDPEKIKVTIGGMEITTCELLLYTEEPMIENLGRLHSLLKSVRELNKVNDKVKKMVQYPDCRELLQIVLDPYTVFNITGKSLEDYEDKYSPYNAVEFQTPKNFEHLISFLKILSSREISGTEAKIACWKIISENKQYRDTLLCIFDKDLKIDMGIKKVNKAFPGLVEEYEVCLAQKTTDKKDPELLEKWLEKINENPRMWTIQRKIDGLRCLIEIRDGKVTCKSRNGHQFTSLAKLEEAFMPIASTGAELVFDGEVCVIEEDGKENFSAAVSQVRRKVKQMENPKFIIFDAIPMKDFVKRKSELTYSQRYRSIMEFYHRFPSDSYEPIKSYPFSSENFAKLMDVAEVKGWEGLMLRKNVGYEGKRTNNLLKVKKFYVEEYKVDSVNIDTMQLRDPETNLLVEEETMKSVNIIHKRTVVNVGSGWSTEQRRHFYKNPDELVGRVISVQYQEESHNKNDDSISLRIPTLKYLWDEKGRDV